jgi:hypothetical protein
VQKRWLTERVVYMRRRMLAYEAAVMARAEALEAGTEPPKLPLDAGTYSNFANVCQGDGHHASLWRAQRLPNLRGASQ